jgi:hypothetical protein
MLLMLGAATGPAGADDERPDAAWPTSGSELARRVVAGPVVVLADVERVGLKVKLDVLEVLRGADVPDPLRVAFRGDNIAREPGSPAFEPNEGELAIFVLTPFVNSKEELAAPDLFSPAGGFEARIPVPAEGREALLDAIRKIVRFQDEPDRSTVRDELAEWVEGPNPWLIDFALDQAARFAYADEDWIPALLRHTAAASDVRRRLAVEAIAVALARGRFDAPRSARRRLAETAGQERVRPLRQAVVRLARTDDSPEVRRAAVSWLPRVGGEDIAQLLTAIARDDPSHEVRYEAASGLQRLEAR